MKFCELISSYFIKIPLLQRDYVQGAHEKIARDFLSAIFENLAAKKPMQIDFIYGYLEGKFFIPIDGQQRLITLFLLHLYFKNCSQNLHKFSYKSRQSTKDFCEFLRKNFDEIKEQKIKQKISLEKAIKNHEKYLYIFNFDPSANAMMKMLDLIDKYAYFWKIDEANLDLIEFEFFNLKNLENGEELYIKMNARGKALSSFENFKSTTHQEFLKANLKDFADRFAKKIDGICAVAGYKIAKKIDKKFNPLKSDNHEEILKKFWQFLSKEYELFMPDNDGKMGDKKAEFLLTAMDNLEEIFKNYDEFFCAEIDAKKIKIDAQNNKNILHEFFSEKNDFKPNLKQRAIMFFYIDFFISSRGTKDEFISFLRLVNNLLFSTSSPNFKTFNIKLNEEEFYKICRQIYESKNALNYKGFCEQIEQQMLEIQGIKPKSLQLEAQKLELLNELENEQKRAFIELEQSEYFFCDAALPLKCKDFCAAKNLFERAKNYADNCEKKSFLQKLHFYADFSIYAHNYGSLYFGLKRDKLDLLPLFCLKYKDDWFEEQNKITYENLQEQMAIFVQNFDDEIDVKDFCDEENFFREILVKFPELFDESSQFNIFAFSADARDKDNVWWFKHAYIYKGKCWCDNNVDHIFLNYLKRRFDGHLSKAKRENDYEQTLQINDKDYQLHEDAYENLCKLSGSLDELENEELKGLFLESVSTPSK